MQINGKTRTLGLIGNPVEHTVSPVIHNNLADFTGDNLAYVPFCVENGQLKEAVIGGFALNILGFNVTVPYKSDVIPYLTDIDDLAKRIGAVNTLVRNETGFKGYNTDMPGLLRAMKSDGVDIQGQEVILLGAGGVARAVAMLLADNGAKQVYILNRTMEKAQAIADEVNGYIGREFVRALLLSDYTLLDKSKKYITIQATSVGMHPNTEACIIEDEAFYDLVSIGYDIIFNPLQTSFMKKCKAHGAEAFHGLKMLLYQGIIAYELWTKKDVPDEYAEKIYEKMLDAMRG